MNAHTILSTTVDDSIGEAFDKVTRLLNLPWLPGRSGGPGATLERYASLGNASKYNFPIPMTKDKSQLQNSNMSFSGLKTAVKYLIEEEKLDVQDDEVRRDLAAAFQHAAVEHLIGKLRLCVEECCKGELNVRKLVCSGGVARNGFVRER